MTTVADLVQDTRRELHGMHRPEYATLGGAIADTDVSLTLGTTTPVTDGTLLAIDDEIVMVWTLSGTTYSIQRGMLGTTAAGHDAGVLVEVNPRFPDYSIKDALQKEIRSWEPRVFATETFDLAATSGDRAVLLNLDDVQVIDVLKVLRSPRHGQDSWFPLTYRYERELDTIYLDQFNGPADLKVTVALPIDVDSVFDDDTDLLDLGMSVTQFDIAVLGAAWRLVIGREIKRNFMEAQGEPRASQEVPPGAIANSARLMKALRDERLREEMNRLRGRFPFRRR